MSTQLFETVIFTVSNWAFTVGKLVGVFLIALLTGLLIGSYAKNWKDKIYKSYEVNKATSDVFNTYVKRFILILSVYLCFVVLGFDVPFYTSEDMSLTWGIFFIALLILVSSNIINWLLINIVQYSYNKRQTLVKKSPYHKSSGDLLVSRAARIIRYIVLVIAGILIIRNFNIDFSLYKQKINDQYVDFRITKLLVASLAILIGRLVHWVITNLLLYNVYSQRNIAEGSRYAVNQILNYVIQLIAIVIALNTLGIDMTLLLGGAAALMVGIGLGLQQTFNDFFSGLVLLFERSVSVGDFLNFGEVRGTVKRIGARSSIIETVDGKNIVIPNSQLVNDSVYNWNHFDDTVRFEIKVGVAYGSDTKLVRELLLEAVKENRSVLPYPSPFVLFDEFGDSSLDFIVYYYSDLLVKSPNVKSDIRFRIDELFRANNVEIPFPQRDVWMRKC